MAEDITADPPSAGASCNATVDISAGPDAISLLPSAMPERQEDCCDDNRSVSELECPICYQLYCDPVRAGCDRHSFCRNCLLRSQRGSELLRCPICRCESRLDASNLPVATDLHEKVMAKDPKYDERLAVARREREEYMETLVSRVAQVQHQDSLRSGHYFNSWSTLRGIPFREVCDAGSTEVNGIYVAGVLPSYVGPPLYRKLNTTLFIFRWRQTRWVIAELRSSRSMGDDREWLYHAPAQAPEELPPTHGWEVTPRSRASRPAPEVRIFNSSDTRPSVPEVTTEPEPTRLQRSSAVAQRLARCVLRPCSIM